MTTFEEELRQSLHDAAGASPAFQLPEAVHQGRSGAAPARRGRTRARWVAVAAAIAVAITCAGVLWALQRPEPPLTSCAGELIVDGRTYVGWGDLVSVPRAEQSIGTGTVPACSDGSDASDDEPARTVELFQVPGVDPSQAVFAEGRVWIVDGGDVPPGVRALAAPIPCRGEGMSTVEGIISEIDPDAVVTAPPYAMTFVADSGARLPLEDFESVALDVLVTPTTKLRDGPELVGVALRSGQRVRAVVACDGTQFEARELALV